MRRSLAAMTCRGAGLSSKTAGTAVVLVLLAVSASAAPERVRNHFDSDAPMRAPGFFDFVELGTPAKAEWRVMADFNPPSTPNTVSQVLARRPADSIAAAIRRNVQLRDGTLTISQKRTEAQGGLVFRMVDERTFLAIFVNPVTGEGRLLAYRNGQPTELARGKAPAGTGWGTLVVTLAGPRIAATWRDNPLLEATDPLPVSGKTGMAASGPGVATFDEFLIDPKE